MLMLGLASYGIALLQLQRIFIAITRLVGAFREKCRRIRLELDTSWIRHPGGYTRTSIHFIFVRESHA